MISISKSKIVQRVDQIIKVLRENEHDHAFFLIAMNRKSSAVVSDKRMRKYLGRIKETPNGCYFWHGYLDGNGYGAVKIDKHLIAAHRVFYLHFVGEILEKEEVDHLCRNRNCVNIAHLESVPKRVNILRGEGRGAKQARQTHCLRGHELNKENTYFTRTGHRRNCRLCLRLRRGVKRIRGPYGQHKRN